MKFLVLVVIFCGFTQASAQCDGQNLPNSKTFEMLAITNQARPVGWFKGPSALESGFATHWNSPAQISWDVFGIRRLPETAVSVINSVTNIALLIPFDRNNEEHWLIKKTGGTRREYLSTIRGDQAYFRYLSPPRNFSEKDSEEVVRLLLSTCPFHLLQSPLQKNSGVYTSGIGHLIRMESESGVLDVRVYLKRAAIRIFLDGEYLTGGILLPGALNLWEQIILSELL